jgi:hypothetical protein
MGVEGVDMDAAHAKGCFAWAGVSVGVVALRSYNLMCEYKPSS